MEQPTQQIHIQAEREGLKGVYTNAVMVTAQERDVVIDFLSQVKIQEQTSTTLVSRVFLNHHVAADLAKLLINVRKQWEEKKYGSKE
ncbi:MAG: DUF3467 domain-containing protein [bacterium]|nr:DUF3467 domain-containing protein [bacterium]